MMIIISNGFGKFHMATAAAESEKRGNLTRFITGAYPTDISKKIIRNLGFQNSRKVNRFLAREENLPDHKVANLWLPESLQAFGYWISKLPFFSSKIADFADIISMRWYARLAIPAIISAAQRGAKIYHYRAGFGHASVNVAKELGLLCICDHSIVHPEVLSSLVEGKGQILQDWPLGKTNYLWKQILADIERADYVVVNSEFVKKTFLDMGWDASRIAVVILGVDNAFFNSIPKRKDLPAIEDKYLRILFAGSFSRRKGAEILIEALQLESQLPWRLEIAGSIDPHISRNNKIFFSDSRVKLLGVLSRSQLAKKMVSTHIFTFPSFAEGSARVVFEALACGSYVITTPNSGSIICDGVDGRLVPPGNASALEDAIHQAYKDPDERTRIGKRAAERVTNHFRQEQYGEKLSELYAHVLSTYRR